MLRILGKTIVHVSVVKDLGIDIDQSLTYNYHINPDLCQTHTTISVIDQLYFRPLFFLVKSVRLKV